MLKAILLIAVAVALSACVVEPGYYGVGVHPVRYHYGYWR